MGLSERSRAASLLNHALIPAFMVVLSSGCYLSHRLPEDAGPPPDARPDALPPPDARPPPDATADALRDTSPDAPPIDAGPIDAGPIDAGPIDAGPCDAGPIEPGLELSVDMLFVIDSSGSMSEEQQALGREFPRMVRALATGDLDEDGRPEFEPVTDLRVAVVTTELATGDIVIPGCTPSALDGDDGVLRTHGYFWRDECVRDYPPFLEFRAEAGGAERFVADFSCVSQVGTEGCGIEQPLEAALKALTPSTSDITFLNGRGRRDRENAGFVRDDAILAVVIVTDEDDCSVADPALYDVENEEYPWSTMPPSPRCFAYPEALMPTERYVEGFSRFKPTDPDSFFFAAIAGVPPDLVSDPTGIDYDTLRADPRMQLRVDPERPERLLPACDIVGIGYAEPARRIVDVVEALGENATLRSICDATFTEALDGITAQLGRVIRRRRCR